MILFTCAACVLAAPPARAAESPLALAQAPPLAREPVVSTGVAAGGAVFSTVYDTRDWTGSLQAHRIDPVTGALAEAPAWRSAALQDAAAFDPALRTVLSHDGTTGIPFRWEALAEAERALLAGPEGEAAGRERLDFVRGDHRREAAQGGPLRDRRRLAGGIPFRQGDIVHSLPWYTGAPVTRFAHAGFRAFRSAPDIAGRPAMVYVGGNDGMLHGVDAADGKERLAYLPRGIVGQLRAFARRGWQHRYLVDGSAFTGDADTAGHAADAPRWATVLVGATGAGARGYFVLDVSRPQAFAEASAAALVLLDTTGSEHPDIGHIVSEPAAGPAGAGSQQIVRLNNGRWAALLGNGFGSPSQMPVLLVQYLDRGRELLTLAPACPPQPAPCRYRGGNGLAMPTVIDIDGDGMADIAYAGDLLGHVWKFDLSATDAALWKVAFAGAPLFTARDAEGRPQPIVAAPAWLPHPQGGVMLAVGTGRQLTVADRGDTRVQTLYGLYDDSRAVLAPSSHGVRLALSDGTPINTPDTLRRPVTLAAQQQLPEGTAAAGHTYLRTAPAPGGAGDAVPRGWYFDLPASGERVLQAPWLLAGRKVIFRSTADGQDYLTVLELVTGHPPAAPVFAAPSQLQQDATTAAKIGASSRVSMPAGGFAFASRADGLQLLSASAPHLPTLRKGQARGQRADWRQVP